MLSVTVCVALCLVVIVRIYFLKTVRLLYTNSYKYLRLAFIKSETRTVLRRVAPVPPLHYADTCMQDAEREWDGQICLCLNVEKSDGLVLLSADYCSRDWLFEKENENSCRVMSAEGSRSQQA